MAPAKGSRKGKKAWRKNINTRQLEEDVAQQQREEQQGTALQTLTDTNLFFVDKAGDEKTASAVSKGLSRKRKQLAQPLRCELIAGVHKPAGSVSAQSGPKARGKLVLPHQRKQPQVQLQQKHQGKGVYKLPASSTFDLWDEQPDTTDPRLDRYNNIPGAINGTADQPSKRRKQAVKLATKAVVVDAAGCSYNPDIEHHQEALSQAVAAEMQKVYKHDMQPRSVPRFVDYQPETDELALLQVDAEPDSDEDGVRLHTAAAPAAAFSTRIKQTKRDQASRMRHRLQEVEERTRRALKTQRRDIDNLRQLQLQVQAEEAVRAELRAAKAAARAEKATHQPPRLGKVKFEAEPVQVLLSEEVTGSLRKLKPTATLTRDRFKSLQRRGMIEPRVAVRGKKKPRRVSYTQGERADKAEVGMEEIRAIQNKRKGQ
ncbi:nop53 (60S ribosomal biogenesis) [Trebouxia sp. C0010 RCD-2024]